MKGFGLYLVLLLLFVQSLTSTAQIGNDKHRIKLQNKTLKEAIDTISSVYKVNFSYNAQLPELRKNISVDTEGTLSEVLQVILSSFPLGYDILGRQVVFFPLITSQPAKSVFASKDSIITITGKIFNTQQEPLSFASVSIINKDVSTVANSEGFFRLKIPSNYRTDTLVVSFLGYLPKKLRIDTITQQTLIITLAELPIELPPVFVRNISAVTIIENVIANVNKNYYQQNAMYSAFYREVIKNEENYLSIIEALVDIAKAPYSSWLLNDQAKIFKGHRSQSVNSLSTLSIKLEGGVYNCVKIDLIKESPVFLSREGLSEYVYRVEGKIKYNERNLYIIRFEPLKRLSEIAYQGFLYIDDQTYALVAAEFGLTPLGIEYAQHLLVKKVPRKTQVKLQEARYAVFYRPMNQKWFLEYTSIELKLKAKSRFFLLNNIISTRSELAITRIDTTNHARFKRDEIVHSNDVMIDMISRYHDDFWEHYNIIAPEEPLIRAINKLSMEQNEGQTLNLWNTIFNNK
ncbi:MAG: carboxypeptidase-like regulatory domain-containing protein [Bacteroidales bacterium]|nr:carboxypeptidase-like regulatory domain-containing protein [Bacteroidales bacterium]